jgi:hypothetical protein
MKHNRLVHQEFKLIIYPNTPLTREKHLKNEGNNQG